MNKKRSLYNITVSLASQAITIILGIFIPRLFLLNFGSEMNGFLNSTAQIFAYFTLFEAGVGAVAVQALYGPVANSDRRKVSSIMAAINQYYKKTGFYYLLAVVGLAVGYPFVVDSTIDRITIIVIILINGIPGILSYFYLGKYMILLQAEGKNYVNTIAATSVTILNSISKIILLILGCNIIVIQSVHLCINILKIILINWYIKKKYVWIDLKEEADYSAINQKNAGLVHQISELIFRNTDLIILSIFCDLKTVSVYSMYTMLFSMVRTALNCFTQGVTFSLGQTYNKNIKTYIKYHDLYETYQMAFSYALYNISFLFIIPFIRLYTSGINDINYIDWKLTILFVIFYLLTSVRVGSADLINFAQHFKLTQKRCIIEATINLTVSIIAVNFWGIYGVLLGTIVALLYRANDMILYANNRILKRGSWITYRKILSNTIVFVIITLCASKLPWVLNSYVAIIGWACISGIIIAAIYFAVASIVNRESFAILKGFVRK